MTVFLWILAVAMIVIGVLGTVLPALPGSALVFAGALLAAWIDDFARLSAWTLVVLGVLTVLTFVVDVVSGALGAKRVGASPLAMVGAAVGTVAGVFTGLVGLLFLPLVGAVIGEFVAERDVMRAGRAGVATWLGLLIGTAVKVAIVFTMVGVIVVALLL